MEWINLVQSKIAALKIVKEFRVGATPGAEGFDCKRVNSGLAKMGEEQSRQHRFADAGVSAGNENCFGS